MLIYTEEYRSVRARPTESSAEADFLDASYCVSNTEHGYVMLDS